MTTTRYTESEWRAIISDLARELQVYEQDYCPDIDRIDIARTIDHTLLKLDASPKQIDELCAEARVANFAACLFHQPCFSLAFANAIPHRASASDQTTSPKPTPTSKAATSSSPASSASTKAPKTPTTNCKKHAWPSPPAPTNSMW